MGEVTKRKFIPFSRVQIKKNKTKKQKKKNLVVQVILLLHVLGLMINF